MSSDRLLNLGIQLMVLLIGVAAIITVWSVTTVVQSSRQIVDEVRQDLQEHRVRNEEVHTVLECILLVSPELRTPEWVDRCEEQAERIEHESGN